MSGLLVILYIWNFIRTILVIVVVYYAFKIIGKIIFASALNQAKTNIKQNQQQTNRKREGEVTIVTDKKNSSKYDNNDSEYVDFEEVD